MQVLSRRTKNNPVLIGEPGVGKTAVVEGLSQDIVRGEVPETLKGKQIYTLDLGALVAGLALPRRLRGAPQEGAEGDQDPRRHHLVHRRAAHAGRRRRGRGRDRRGLHPQADARSRRAADDRRHHARRVPQAPREGRGPRAAVPADHGQRAHGPAHHRDPEGPARPVRGAPPRELHRRRARRGREPGGPLHQRPVPARQGHRPHRRGRQPHAHPPHDRAARRPRDRREDRRGAPPQGIRHRRPGLRARGIAARRGTPAPGGAHPPRGGVEVRRDGHPVRGRRGGDRRGPVHLDRHPGLQAHRGGDREAAPDGGRAPQADRHAERGHLGRVARHPPDAFGSEGPAPALRFVHLPRALGRREDRAVEGARGVPVRRRGRADPARHVRVHGEAHRHAG